MDSNSTILSAYSSRSNSSLSERSKTSPTPLKQIPYLPITNIHLPITTDDEVTQLTSFENYQIDITPKQSPLPSTSEQFQINQNKLINKRRKTITNEIQRPTTRSRSISERGGRTSCSSSSTEPSTIITRKRKASIDYEQNEIEVKRTTIDYIKHLDGKRESSFFKLNHLI